MIYFYFFQNFICKSLLFANGSPPLLNLLRLHLRAANHGENELECLAVQFYMNVLLSRFKQAVRQK